jgi:hypothetical protein
LQFGGWVDAAEEELEQVNTAAFYARSIDIIELT